MAQVEVMERMRNGWILTVFGRQPTVLADRGPGSEGKRGLRPEGLGGESRHFLGEGSFQEEQGLRGME